MNKRKLKKSVDESLSASAVVFSEDSIVITDKELDEPGPEIVYVRTLIDPDSYRMEGKL